jgi:hypothetical protein
MLVPQPQTFLYKELSGKFSFSPDGLFIRDENGVHTTESCLFYPMSGTLSVSIPGHSESPTDEKSKGIRGVLRRLRRKQLMKNRPAVESSLLTQSSNSVFTSSNENGDLTLSLLQGIQSHGAVVLHTFCQDGTVQSETLTRLPPELTIDVEAVLLPSREGEDEPHEVMRIALNQSPRPGYVIGERPRYSLPAIIEREKRTIPVVRDKAQLKLNESMNLDIA